MGKISFQDPAKWWGSFGYGSVTLLSTQHGYLLLPKCSSTAFLPSLPDSYYLLFSIKKTAPVAFTPWKLPSDQCPIVKLTVLCSFHSLTVIVCSLSPYQVLYWTLSQAAFTPWQLPSAQCPLVKYWTLSQAAFTPWQLPSALSSTEHCLRQLSLPDSYHLLSVPLSGIHCPL